MGVLLRQWGWQQKQKEEMREKERKVGDFIYFAILFHNMEATDLIIWIIYAAFGSYVNKKLSFY